MTRSPDNHAEEDTRLGVVLLVEDDEELRSLYAFALRRMGYEVHALGHVSEAYQLLSTGSVDFDVALVDAEFEVGPSGVDLMEELARGCPRVTRVLLSTRTPDWFGERTRRCCDTILHIPFPKADLRSAIGHDERARARASALGRIVPKKLRA